MKIITVILCIIMLSACSEKKEICSYQKDNYQYAKERHGAKSRQAEAARIDVLDCMSRKLSSHMRRMQ